jgi:hypothetical protein
MRSKVISDPREAIHTIRGTRSMRSEGGDPRDPRDVIQTSEGGDLRDHVFQGRS